MHNSQDNATLHSLQLAGSKQQPRTNEDGTITIHIPITLKKHGGRRYIISPDNLPAAYLPPQEKDSILKAIGQAFAWKEMIDSGKVTSVADLALKLEANESYTGRVLRLTMLAPDIISAILHGRQPKHLTLRDFLKPIPYSWEDQRQLYGFAQA